MNTCVGCRDDGDCPSGAPRCGIDAQGLAQCFECVDDSDCPLGAPACDVAGSTFGATGGGCQLCSTNDDCATGLCSLNDCVPQCSNDADCGAPEFACVAARCIPRPCTSNGDCPIYFGCTNGACAREGCQTDGDCGGGTCVGGRCYDGLGACYEHYLVP